MLSIYLLRLTIHFSRLIN